MDIDECSEGLADCEQLCVNTPGSFSCKCENGFLLRGDNKTCEESVTSNSETVAAASRCYANCDTVLRLHDKVKSFSKSNSLQILLKYEY